MATRRTAALLVASFLAGALVVAALPAGADRDDALLAGRANGAKAYNTSLYSTNNKATLSLYNRNGSGAPALALSSNAGPALEIDSTQKIVNLNADLLDGLSAHRFLDRTAECDNSNIGDPAGSTWTCDTDPAVMPTYGFVLMTGSVDIHNNNTWDVVVECSLSVRYNEGSWSKVADSDRDVTVPPSSFAICATTAAEYMGDGATLEVRFEVASIDASVALEQGNQWWIYIPG